MLPYFLNDKSVLLIYTEIYDAKERSAMNRIKKILAWTGIIVLVLLYLVTFLLGVFGNPHTQNMLKACIVLTVVIPVLIYAMMMLAKILSRKHDQEPDP